MSEEALQIAEQRRKAKGKGGREIYTQLNAEFQRIVRSDKKSYKMNYVKKTEENNRIGKIRDLVKKTRYQGSI